MVKMLAKERGPRVAHMRAWHMAGAAVALAAVAGGLCGRPALASEAPKQEATSSANIEEITVTGTRIAQPDFEAPTPVTSISAKELEVRGTTNLNDALRQLPSTNSFNPSASQSASNAGVGGVNLRGMGANRTLVLLNGRRQVPSTDTGIMDTNTIPSVAIGQIEVVTGGASAGWGSDAIAGVVNIFYDTKLQGTKFDAQSGETIHGDAQNSRVSIASGTSFANDRGHVMIAGEWNKLSQGVRQSDRDWGRQGWGIIGNAAYTATNGQPRLLLSPNIRISNATLGGVITAPAALAKYAFGPGGAVLPFSPGANTVAPLTIGGTNTDSMAPMIASPYERKSLTGSVHYELADDLEGYFETLYSGSKIVDPIIYRYHLGNITIQKDNAFIPVSLQPAIAAANVNSFTLGRLNSEFGYYTAHNKRTVVSAAAGIKGKLGTKFVWDAYLQHGESTTDTYQDGNLLIQNFNWAVDAVVSPTTGKPVCRVTLNLATVPSGLASAASACIPFNVFGQGSPSQASVNYIAAISSADRQQTQDVGAVNVSGDVASLWAGPLSVAVGGEHRREVVKQQTDSASVQKLLLASNGIGGTGAFSVTEFYAEAQLPLAKDLPIAENLGVDAAFRHSDYSTIGGVSTWKAGLSWEPISGAKFRASYSDDIRAPSAAELYSPGVRTTFTASDPCLAASQAANPAIRARCAAQGLPANFSATLGAIVATQSGNLNLRQEESKTKTAGVILAPEILPGFKASVDWYQINLQGAIASLPAQTLLNSCYQSGAAGACAGISRDPVTRAISDVSTQFINIGTMAIEGIDFQIGYTTDLPENLLGGGSVGGRLYGTNQYKKVESVDGFRSFNIAGQVDPTTQAISTGVPKWRFNLAIDYQAGDLGIHPMIRYIGSANFNNSYGPTDINTNRVSSVKYLDLTVDYKVDVLGVDSTLYIGGTNLADVNPPPAPGGVAFEPTATNFSLYDLLGMTFFGGVRMKF